MRKIAVEEHFYTKTYLDYLCSRKDPPRREVVEDESHNKIERAWDSYYCRNRPVTSSLKLLEMGEKRLNDMDKAGIDMQVLSLSNPGVELFGPEDGPAMARNTNNELAGVIDKHPDRFVGFAAIAPEDPDGAAAELERAVKELGFRGVNINSHINGEYLDDRKYWAIFEKAQALDVPIYLHPREPSPDMVKPYAKYPLLLGAVLGFAAEVGLHTLRLICSGLFDVYPNLRLILGHLGEGLPFALSRIDGKWRNSPLNRTLRKKPSEYFRDNIFVTTSGIFWNPAFMCVYEGLGAGNILFAVDYPYESNEIAADFIEAVPIPDGDKERICHLNAERLLKIGSR